MTNHVHLIASTQQGFELSNIMRDLKKFTSKQLITAITNNPQESRKEWLLTMFANAGEYNANNKNYQFWRQDNKQIELWSNDVIDQKINYIHNNPVVADFVAEPHYWKYSSAIDFSGGKGVLMLTEL
jgi:putative transposase